MGSDLLCGRLREMSVEVAFRQRAGLEAVDEIVPG